MCSCLLFRWSRRRTRCVRSFRWCWPAKTATLSSFAVRSPPSASTPWTPPASAAAMTWTWVMDIQVDTPPHTHCHIGLAVTWRCPGQFVLKCTPACISCISPLTSLPEFSLHPLFSRCFFLFHAYCFWPLPLYASSSPPSFHLQFLCLGSDTVRITHSHTSESMSFTYQRTHKSVCIDTRPNLRSARPLFESDSEDEEYEGQVEQSQRPLAITYEQPADTVPAGDPAWWFKLEWELKYNRRNNPDCALQLLQWFSVSAVL